MRELLAIVLLGLMALPAAADETRLGDLLIVTPWARATAGSAAGAVYLRIENRGSSADRLMAAASPVADRAAIHAHAIEDGVATMRAVEAIDIGADATAELKPGGLHIMLMGLHQQLREHDRFPLTLTFEHAGSVAVEVRVGKAGAAGPSD